MPSSRRRTLLRALGSASLAGVTGCLDGVVSRTDSSPTNGTDQSPSASPGPAHGTLDAYLRGSRDNEELVGFDAVEVHVAAFVLREVGGKNQCDDPDSTEVSPTATSSDATPSQTATPNPTDAETPSPVPRHESMVDVVRFDLDETVDVVAHRNEPAFVGRFRIPAVDYWQAAFFIDRAVGRRDGETFELIPDDHVIAAGQTHAQVGDPGWSSRELVAPVQVGEAPERDPYLYSFGVFLGADLPVSPPGDPRVDRGAVFRRGPTAGERATLQLTRQGEPAAGAGVVVDGKRLSADDGGEVTFDVPPEPADRVEKTHCLRVQVLD